MEPVGGWGMVDGGCGWWMWILDGRWWSMIGARWSEGMQLLIRFDCGGGNRWSEINSLTRYQN